MEPETKPRPNRDVHGSNGSDGGHNNGGNGSNNSGNTATTIATAYPARSRARNRTKTTI